MTKYFTPTKAETVTVGEEALRQSIDRAPLTEMRVALQFPRKYPSYDDVQAITPGEGTYPQGMWMHENLLYLMHGGSWVVVYDMSDMSEVTVFRCLTTYTDNASAVEGLVVHRDGGARYLTTICNSPTYGERRLCRFDITTLPANLSTPTPDMEIDYECQGHVTTDGSFLYVGRRNRGFGPNTNNRVTVFRLDDLSIQGEIHFNQQVYGGSTSSTENKKTQSLCAHEGTFYLFQGSAVDDPVPETYTRTPAITKCNMFGKSLESVGFDTETIRETIQGKGYDANVFEFEGSCSYEGSVYANVVINKDDDSQDGVWIVEIETPGLDLSESITNQGYSISERTVQCDSGGITNPSTGLQFTSCTEILLWMRQTGKTTFSFYTAGSSILSFDGVVFPSNRLVELVTGRYTETRMTVTVASEVQYWWCTGDPAGGEGAITQTLIGTVPV